MKRLIAALVIMASAVAAISSAQNVNNGDYPPGIALENWISMGASAGFVVTSGDFQGSNRATGTLKGYFVLRRGGTWFRVDTSAP